MPKLNKSHIPSVDALNQFSFRKCAFIFGIDSIGILEYIFKRISTEQIKNCWDEAIVLT